MVDRDFIRAVIQEAAKGRRSRKDIAPVLADLDGYVEKTYELVATESFVPSEPKIREIYDESSEKHRKIKMVPFWPDGVIQWMLVTAMKPVLMRGMHPWSCASIPGRGGKHIYKKIRGALRNDPKGTKYAAELDVAQYYPRTSAFCGRSIPSSNPAAAGWLSGITSANGWQTSTWSLWTSTS